MDLSLRDGATSIVAINHSMSRGVLYKWRRALLSEKGAESMGKVAKPSLPDDRETLLAEVESLKKQIYRQQMELDILQKVA